MALLKRFYHNNNEHLCKYFKSEASFISWLTSWHAHNKKARQEIKRLVENSEFEIALKVISIEIKKHKNYIGQ